MVQAIQNNRKTMTRRTRGLDQIKSEYVYKGIAEGLPATHCFARLWKGNWVETKHAFCPHGIPGDLLWVKETFYAYGLWTTITENGKSKNTFHDLTIDSHYIHQFAADWKPEKEEKYHLGWHKRPALFMPKSIARIWLEITDVKVERVQDITEGGAFYEGVDLFAEEFKQEKPNVQVLKASYVRSFKTLWQSINGPESWDANPWVWVISFKVLSTTGKPGDI